MGPPRKYQVNEPGPPGVPTQTHIPGHTLAHSIPMPPPHLTKVKHMAKRKSANKSAEVADKSAEVVEIAETKSAEVVEIAETIIEAVSPEAAAVVEAAAPILSNLADTTGASLQETLRSVGLLHKMGRVHAHPEAKHIPGDKEHHKLFQSIGQYWRRHPISADDLIAIGHAVLKLVR